MKTAWEENDGTPTVLCLDWRVKQGAAHCPALLLFNDLFKGIVLFLIVGDIAIEFQFRITCFFVFNWHNKTSVKTSKNILNVAFATKY